MHPSRKIKLFVDAHAFDKEHQGTRSYIKRLYSELAKQTDRIEFYFGAKDILNLRKELGDLPSTHFISYKSGSSAVRLFLELPVILRKHRIDLAHFQYISPFFTSVSTIVTTHDVLFLDFKGHFPFLYRVTRQYLFRRSLKKALIRTTVSDYSQNRISRHFKIAEKSIDVLPSGVDDSFFEPFEKGVSKAYLAKNFGIEKFILCVSRFEPRKNHALLLQSYLNLRLHEKKIFLVLLGHSSMSTPAFSSRIASLPHEIRRYILIDDRTGDDDLFHFYRGADVFVYPSLAEGFGLPPIEAGALKIPVLCSNLTAMSDFQFFGRFHVDPRQKDKFEAALHEILENPPGREQLDAIAGEIRKRYSFNASAARLKEKILTIK